MIHAARTGELIANHSFQGSLGWTSKERLNRRNYKLKSGNRNGFDLKYIQETDLPDLNKGYMLADNEK